MMANRLVCPRCESGDLGKLAPTKITNNPGYVCNQCQLSMRHSASVLVPFVIMILATIIFVITTLPWVGAVNWKPQGKWAIMLPFGSLAVAVFCLQQMVLPAPKWMDVEAVVNDDGEQNAADEEAIDLTRSQ